MTPAAVDDLAIVQSLERARLAGLRVAVAESLTGGLLADGFVSLPGASAVFSGAVVAYHTAIKHSLLAVDEALLHAYGPVHERVAQQMAYGVRFACALPSVRGNTRQAADIGLSTTGVAGPQPDAQTGQRAGTVWLGVSSRLGNRSVGLSLAGKDRARIRAAAVRAAMCEFAVELDALAATKLE